MRNPAGDGPLRIGLLGSGFIAGFHLDALLGVRDVVVAGVFSPTPAHREALAQRADAMGLGPCRAYGSVGELVASGEVDAVWILGPNDTRIDHMRAIHKAVKEDGARLLGVACEKPLARTLAEAREMLRLAEDADLSHGYLENQVFSTAVQRGKEVIWRRGVPAAGRPYLARAAEEHSGPHAPWFWLGEKQGGGVLSDMMCHSVEVARYLLTEPGKGRETLELKSANATVANLKWTRPRYAEQLKRQMGPEVDYTTRPAEDFARGTLILEDENGVKVMIEATTSWSYVGPGLRIQLELLGPEYAMEFSTLNTGLKIFLSRNVTGAGEASEDLVEKQSAEQGLMPVLEDEAATYGYTLEDRHMVEAFRRGEEPLETFHDGVAVVEMLMALYRSAETGRTVHLPDEDLETYVPPVARGEYRG
jgi:predicted dehydrogenase